MIDVVGTVGFYNGKTELTTPGLVITVQSSGNPLPSPAEITTFELAANGEIYDDCFIKIRCVQIVGGDPWPIAGSNANIQINDGSGITVLRIDKETDIDGSPAPVGEFTVIGLGTQFDSTSPYSDSYQILPRSLADLVYDCTVFGACCFADGHCELLDEAACLAGPGQRPVDSGRPPAVLEAESLRPAWRVLRSGDRRVHVRAGAVLRCTARVPC